MVHENGKPRAKHCWSFMIRINDSKHFHDHLLDELIIWCANTFEERSADDQPLRFRGAMLLRRIPRYGVTPRQAAITIVYRLYGER